MLLHKIQNQSVDLLGRFHLHHVRLTWQDLDLGLQPGAVAHRNNRVVTAPDQQRWQPAVLHHAAQIELLPSFFEQA